MDSQLPIVGAFFRPPAKVVISHCTPGQGLKLLREPENPHDPNAVAVYLDAEWPDLPTWFEALKAIPTFEAALQNCGYTLDELQAAPAIQLGYIARAHAMILAEYLDRTLQPVAAASLSFDAAGKPFATLLASPSTPES